MAQTSNDAEAEAAGAPDDPVGRLALADLSRALGDQADRHALTLESILAVLRSPRVTDTAARAEAVDVASAALVHLRTATDQHRVALLEPVSGAFSRLRADLRPLVRFGDLDVQFVEPPVTGRALPGAVARSARAIVRAAVLALVDAGAARRVRIQWDCDGRNLLMQLRDDGAGTLDAHDDALRPIAERVVAVDGRLDVESTSGWGSVLDITIPLDPPPGAAAAPGDDSDLTPRELDVLRLLSTGIGNREIADGLGISLNTVKYHVANLLRKHGARTRTELAAFHATAPSR